MSHIKWQKQSTSDIGKDTSWDPPTPRQHPTPPSHPLPVTPHYLAHRTTPYAHSGRAHAEIAAHGVRAAGMAQCARRTSEAATWLPAIAVNSSGWRPSSMLLLGLTASPLQRQPDVRIQTSHTAQHEGDATLRDRSWEFIQTVKRHSPALHIICDVRTGNDTPSVNNRA